MTAPEATPRTVLLVSLDWMRPKDPRTTLGHASLLASLQRAPDLEVRALSRAVNSPRFDRGELLEAVKRELDSGATDLALGVYVWNEAHVRWLLRALRRDGHQARVILGGPQLSYAPEGLRARYPEADVLIRGYGEDALLHVLSSPPGTPFPGVTLQGQPDLAQQAQVTLAELPSPILSGVLPIQPFMRWETQRGCPYACSFCQHREAGARLKRSTLGEGRVRDELDALVRGGATDIAVLDPIFNFNPDASTILERFAELGYRGKLSLQSRFELLDERFLDACAKLDVVLEFGLQTVIPSEMKAANRTNKLDKVERAIQELHRRGLHFEVSLIYGLPTQTLASFEASVAWCVDRGVPVIQAFPLMLLRGTKLEQDRATWGLVESDDVIPVVVESDSFSRSDWEQMRALADSLAASDALGSAA